MGPSICPATLGWKSQMVLDIWSVPEQSSIQPQCTQVTWSPWAVTWSWVFLNDQKLKRTLTMPLSPRLQGGRPSAQIRNSAQGFAWESKCHACEPCRFCKRNTDAGMENFDIWESSDDSGDLVNVRQSLWMARGNVSPKSLPCLKNVKAF